MAEASAFNARSGECNGLNISNLSWAEIATSVYDYLTDEVYSGTKESFITSFMLLRAAMIVEFGSVDDHFVLDSNQIIHWFFHRLTISLDEVTQKAENGKRLNIEDIRELRRIKNRLNIIIALAESDKFTLNEELRAWLSLRNRLP